MLPNPRVAHQRLVLSLGGSLTLLSVISLAACLLLFQSYEEAIPRLYPNGPLAKALRWPWNDFPSITEIELGTIRREVGMGEPLVQGRMILWFEATASGPGFLGVGDSARTRFNAALEPLAALQQEERESPSVEQIERAIQGLDWANALRPQNWAILYNRGILAAWRGKWQAAVDDLEESQGILNYHIGSLSGLQAESTSVRNAAALTAYALGSARYGLAESSALPTERSTYLHAAINAYQVAGRYVSREVQGALNLRTGKLPVSTIYGDLLAAYLKANGFHQCKERPEYAPACKKLGIVSPCVDRDSNFCEGFKNAADTDPLSKQYVNLYHRFYRGEESVWESENFLWAMALAISLGSDVSQLKDPGLLANLGVLAAQFGEFELALGYLGASLDHTARLRNTADATRILRLVTTYGVLTEMPFPQTIEPSGETSPVRRTFLRLHGSDTAALRLTFPAVSTDETQALFDRWLFIRFWRTLLAAGEFERFTQEYDRLMREDDLFKDFFAQWHDEVLNNLGKRALGIAGRLEQAGEHDRAHVIRAFLSANPHFPPAIRSQARTSDGWRGWIGWAGWRFSFWLAAPALLLIVMRATIYCLGIIRLHRKTFFSFHRLERKGAGEAYPPGDPRE